jgi:hypothetical protein
MNESNETPKTPRDAANWARPVEKFDAGTAPAHAINLNVAGRRATGPLQGFGQMWQKTYRIRLTGVQITPQEVIREWKSHFPEFWPKGNNFYACMTSIEPGEVAVLNLAMPGGMKLSTGVRVIYADDESFSFMTPEGHQFASIITFSAFEDEADGTTVIQIQPLLRASDPIYEMGVRIGFAFWMEDRFWHTTLRNLAAYFGSKEVGVEQKNVMIDRRVQWSEAKNVWHNAAIRTAVYMPVHVVRRVFTRRN